MIIRPHVPPDNTELVALFEEMQRFYGVACPTRENILADLESLAPGVEILVAERDGLVGFASFSTIYPGPGLKGGFFLKDLFVTKAARGTGTGCDLLKAMAGLALQRGLGRVDWTADRRNARLLAYYDDTGAAREEVKVFFRLAGSALETFAQQK